jgi:hypothetical protein
MGCAAFCKVHGGYRIGPFFAPNSTPMSAIGIYQQPAIHVAANGLKHAVELSFEWTAQDASS